MLTKWRCWWREGIEEDGGPPGWWLGQPSMPCPYVWLASSAPTSAMIASSSGNSPVWAFE